MTLKTKVLVENITNLSEARYCAGMGVHFLGFPAQSVDPKMYKDITGWVHGPEMVLDVSACLTIPTNLNEYTSDYILIRPDQLRSLDSTSSIPFIVELKFNRLDGVPDLTNYRDQISYVLVDRLSESEIRNLCSQNFDVLVAVDETTNLDELLQWPIKGILLSGSNEAKPGLKEYDHLSLVLEKLEINED